MVFLYYGKCTIKKLKLGRLDMTYEVLFEKDMLYPTDNSIEPGCIHIRVMSPDNSNKLPVLIEDKSNHSPLKYIDSIIRLMQTDIFDRILVDIKKNVDLFIKADDNTNKYYKILMTGDKTESKIVEL
jgi:hypothetical protein